ncbi:nucleotide sugar dehydrogenase [Listeria rocourtiae]|uniref:nucleotide sugar dehydrogenase n=1 Tax=Listeria rocourtiae TaxID=647910 RepID=UPI00162AE493|nr:nucleotide sugar dehydrogenase [Listeria rocourtiae]MBC1605504.1 nucleotide sugar dehydrogenase [Listeria rocourtiae]
MKITTIGLGYIGFSTAVLFAKQGHEVVGVDVNKHIVERLSRGTVHLEEPGLQELYREVLAVGEFSVSQKPCTSDAFIIAVPTPNKDDTYKSCDLSYVVAAVKSVIPHLEKGNLLIIESTIAPRTMEDVVQPMIQAAGFTVGVDVYLAHCPERVLPGNIAYELVHNPRIIGGVTPACTEKVKRLYATVVQGALISATASEAELSKLMENTFRDVNIALANELVKIGGDLQIDALKVIEMANNHPRVNLHAPGPGVGGHCLAVDPYFVAAAVPNLSPLIQTARAINTSMPDYVVALTEKLMRDAPTKKIAVFGLTYKGNIDDTRESPAMEIVSLLEAQGYDVAKYDSHVAGGISTMEEACAGSSLILVLTDHAEFIDIAKGVTAKMALPRLLDTKNSVKTTAADVLYMDFGNVHLYTQTREIASI